MAISSPEVSVIMNCHNGERYLSLALDSLFGQSFDNFEVIFWDNASTDSSRDIARSYGSKVRLFSNNEKKNLGEARNDAISKVRGEYICFLDCDDLYPPERLETQIVLMRRSNAMFSYGAVTIIDADGRKTRVLKMARGSSSLGKLLENYEINMQTVMIKTSAFTESGLCFNQSYRYCPDYDLFMRIVAHYGALVIRRNLAFYRVHSASLSSTMLGLVSAEIGETLGSLARNCPEQVSMYNKEFRFAVSKLNYYDAIHYTSRSEYKRALKALKSIKYQSWKFLALFWLVRLAVPKPVIFKLLRR